MNDVSQDEIYAKRCNIEMQIDSAWQISASELPNGFLGIAELLLNLSRKDLAREPASVEQLIKLSPFGLESFASWHDYEDFNDTLKLFDLPALESFSPVNWAETWPQSLHLVATDTVVRRVARIANEQWGLGIQAEHLRSRRTILEFIFNESCESMSDDDCARWLEIVATERDLRWLCRRFSLQWDSLTPEESLRMQEKDAALAVDHDSISQLFDLMVTESPSKSELAAVAHAALAAINDARNDLRRTTLRSAADDAIRNCRTVISTHLERIIESRYSHDSELAVAFGDARSRLISGESLLVALSCLPPVPNEDVRSRIARSEWGSLPSDPPVWLWSDAVAWREAELRDLKTWRQLLTSIPGKLGESLQIVGVSTTTLAQNGVDYIIGQLDSQLLSASNLAIREISPKLWYRDLTSLLQELELVLPPSNSPNEFSDVEIPNRGRLQFQKLQDTVREFRGLESLVSDIDQSVKYLSEHVSQELQALEAANVSEAEWEDLQAIFNRHLESHSYIELGKHLRRLTKIRNLRRWRQETLCSIGTPSLAELAPWCRLAYRDGKVPDIVKAVARFVDATGSCSRLVTDESFLTQADESYQLLDQSRNPRAMSAPKWHEIVDDLISRLLHAFDDIRVAIRESTPSSPFNSTLTADDLPGILIWWSNCHPDTVAEPLRSLLKQYPRWRYSDYE